MKNNKRTVLLLSFFLPFSLLVPSGISAEGFWHDAGKGCLAAGAAIVGIGGLITAANWLFSESDRDLYERAHRQYTDAYNCYGDTVNWFAQTFHFTQVTASVRDRVLHDCSEPVLYEIATKLWTHNEREYNYRSNLRYSLDQLQSCYNKLLTRIRAIQDSEYDYEVAQVLGQMRTLVRTIESSLPNLRLFSDYLENHRSYFALYESDGKIRNYYQTECNIINQYRHDTYRLVQELMRCALSKQTGSYRLVSYVRELESYLSDVKSRVRRLAYNYASRIALARELIDILAYIKGVIVADPTYTQELRDYEHASIERAHIAAIRERARAERAKADALCDQNHLRRIESIERIFRPERVDGCARVTINM